MGAAARALGRIADKVFAAGTARARSKCDRAARFGRAMVRLANVPDAVIGDIAASTIVCQCEGLSRATLDEAIGQGCVTMNDLRSATRCGMGPCGGRICEDAAARLVAARTALSREAIGQPTGRPPLRPVSLDVLAGDFDYESLPMPQPAPL